MDVKQEEFCEESGCSNYQRIKQLKESSDFDSNFIEFAIGVAKVQCQSCERPRLEYVRWLDKKTQISKSPHP